MKVTFHDGGAYDIEQGDFVRAKCDPTFSIRDVEGVVVDVCESPFNEKSHELRVLTRAGFVIIQSCFRRIIDHVPATGAL
jgi:hypothetical protein